MAALATAAFLRAAAREADLPSDGATEIAFAGRSNVGKSSAINALAGRKALARVSKTPGRTQTINFYGLANGARLVDLPGYGYARVPQAMRERWRALVTAYLDSARGLAGVVLIMDARHPLTPLDEQLLAWLGDTPLLALLSKADKLSRGEQAATLRSVSERLSRHRVTLFSVTRQGVEECRDLLERWLLQAPQNQAGPENKKPPVKGK
jgi:GTP-binding protein